MDLLSRGTKYFDSFNAKFKDRIFGGPYNAWDARYRRDDFDMFWLDVDGVCKSMEDMQWAYHRSPLYEDAEREDHSHGETQVTNVAEETNEDGVDRVQW